VRYFNELSTNMKGFIIFSFIAVTVFIIIILLRGGATNYKDAFIENYNDQIFIKLEGRRKQMVHDPISIILNKTYEDSLLIPLPALADGTIKGKDVSVEKGYYKYEGEIVINKKQAKVNLLINNTDDKKIEPSDWNGEYNLISK
jgi:hypothetical protein